MTNNTRPDSPRIDFYLLSHKKNTDTLHFTCRLIEKAFRSGHTVCVRTNTPEETHMLDSLLWSFRPESFIPHSTQPYNKHALEQSPVLISDKKIQPVHCSTLITLTNEAIPSTAHFMRIFHLIPQNSTTLTSARQTFKTYKTRGVTPRTTRL